MNDLQKDQAIYQAMFGFANEIFSDAVEFSGNLRRLVSEHSNVVSLKQLMESRTDLHFAFYNAIRDVADYICHIEVGTFECRLHGTSIFEHLDYQKSLAKIQGEIFFTYDEKIDNKMVCRVEVNFKNVAGAKDLLNNLDPKNQFYEFKRFVAAEINTVTEDINFIATNGNTLAVISNNPENMLSKPLEISNYQAMFSVEDWKRICDYSRKEKSPVTFEVYKKKEHESCDTMIAVIGDLRIKSTIISKTYPNWRNAIPCKDEMRHYEIHEEDVKEAQRWVKNLKRTESYSKIYVSAYRGSDRIYFDYSDIDFGKNYSVSFRLTHKSDKTETILLSVNRMKKIRFSGFFMQEPDKACIISTEDNDLQLVMPMLLSDPDSSDYISPIAPDIEEREVLETVEETEMVVELAA